MSMNKCQSSWELAVLIAADGQVSRILKTK